MGLLCLLLLSTCIKIRPSLVGGDLVLLSVEGGKPDTLFYIFFLRKVFLLAFSTESLILIAVCSRANECHRHMLEVVDMISVL